MKRMDKTAVIDYGYFSLVSHRNYNILCIIRIYIQYIVKHLSGVFSHMADDVIRQKADVLFRKHGLVRNIESSSTTAADKSKQSFTRDFLAEVKNAARELATARHAEVLQQLKIVDQSLVSAKASGDQAAVIRLEQEREELKRKLHLDS